MLAEGIPWELSEKEAGDMIKKYWYSSLKVPIFAPMINTNI